MKIAIQDRMLPGDSLPARLDQCEQLGVDGIELWGHPDLHERTAEIEDELKGRSVGIASVCGQPHFDWLDPDPDKRAVSVEESKRILAFCGHFGAAGQIVPPIFGPALLPDLSPLHTAVELEKMLLAEIVKELAPYAASHNTLLLLEPLNRYEQHLLNRQQDGVEIIKMAGEPAGVSLLCDFFHMHIEETDTPQAFRDAHPYVGHVHVADNTRMEAGTGDIDFPAGLQALKDIGFDGYLAFESSISGDDPMQSLQKSVDFLRETLSALN